MDDDYEQSEPFEGATAEECYVAFVDVLGFGTQVLNDFDSAFQAYREILNNWRWHYKFSSDVPARIYSDAILLTSTNLGQLIGAVVTLNMVTLMGDCLIRGGIAKGRHIEASEGENVYVVSEALTKAVHLEKSTGWPCVALCKDIKIPPHWWDLQYRNIQRGILYFDDLIIVNPLNIHWGRSAQTRVCQLAAAYPEHQSKYDWFLRLTETIFSDIPLVPPWIVEENSNAQQKNQPDW